MSKTVIRYDRATLRKPERTPQGFLRAEGLFGTAGVYEYRNDDGTIRRELRPLDEVQSAEALASFADASVTLGHPRRNDGEPETVTADNVRKYEVGTVTGSARPEDDGVAGAVVVKDKSAIKKIENGTQELSPGYQIRLEERSGWDPKYGRYDAIQRDIRVNHLALVDRARGGSVCRLRIDEAEVVRSDAELSAKERHALPAEDFAVPGSEGLPIGDETHLKAAMARFNQYDFADAAEKKAAYHKILKKAKALGVDASNFADEYRTDGDVDLTTIAKGHQHTLDCEPSGLEWDGTPKSRNSGCTSYAVSEGADCGHTHDWVRNPDGSITIAMSEGHTHELLEDADDAAPAAPGFYGVRGDGQFDQSSARPEPGLTMTTNSAAGAPPPKPEEQVRLLTVRADEADKTANEQRTRADAAERTAEGLRAELATTRERLKTLETQVAAGTAAVENAAVMEQRTRADAAERELSDLRARQPEMVRRRAGLVAKATAVLGPTFRADSLTEREILVAGIRHLRPKEDTGAHVSEEYLARRFDSLVEDRTAYGASLSRASEVIAVRADSAPAAQAGNKPVAWRDAWKKGAGQFATRKDS